MPKLTIHALRQAKKEGRQLVEIRISDINVRGVGPASGNATPLLNQTRELS